MHKPNILGCCEITVNTAIRRIANLEGKNKEALQNEFREWINAIESDTKKYDVLYINKI